MHYYGDIIQLSKPKDSREQAQGDYVLQYVDYRHCGKVLSRESLVNWVKSVDSSGEYMMDKALTFCVESEKVHEYKRATQAPYEISESLYDFMVLGSQAMGKFYGIACDLGSIAADVETKSIPVYNPNNIGNWSILQAVTSSNDYYKGAYFLVTPDYQMFILGIDVSNVVSGMVASVDARTFVVQIKYSGNKKVKYTLRKVNDYWYCVGRVFEE